MRIGANAGVTDPGRRRRRNEDSLVIDPPLFAVADGMGGAQAGEVASRLAAAVFREYHEADALAGEKRVEAIIQEANRRIYERAQHDAHASGMGTTVTAALVEGDRIALGHVGDSRAYRVRGGTLEQLTQDHSLVADLMRSGRLTPEEAGTHPQRSVITRALGTDPSVDVDTFAVEAAAGDLYLICSDGLTTMLGDEEISRIVSEAADLDTAARALVKAANRRGGEDNVTVILFQLEDGESPGLEETVALSADGQGDPEELEDTLTGLEAPVVPASPDHTTAAWEPVGEPETRSRARAGGARRGRRIIVFVLALALVAVLLLVAFWGLANAHFVGAQSDGRLAVYQGLPYDVGGGVSLYRARYVSELRAVQLAPEERAALFDHDLMAYDAARVRLERFEAEGLP
ncbi:MAG: Stp1/IreP family PP2C-type Ser/Thr phosphatase [Actinobacteria bacterium]|nr:Stp1/IreP family PP2C-type Ser/Thr phosphatase [Actinomycetota bacterium]